MLTMTLHHVYIVAQNQPQQNVLNTKLSTSTILAVIVFSQFACTSLWFAGNAVVADLQDAFQLPANSLGHITSAVQFGFITGTLSFALLTIADRFSPSKVFFVCALLGAVFNASILFLDGGLSMLITMRALTGFMLAGIYPIGMKIASDYHEKGLGKALGYLVGALVLGKAFPFLVKSFTVALSWQYVIIATSILAVFGGLLVLVLVPDGPYRRKSTGLDLTAVVKVFKGRAFRAAAFGYFGHMWELYAFWAFIPVMLVSYQEVHPELSVNVPLFSFFVIGGGALACIVGGYLSFRWGSAKVAFVTLLFSCISCLISPLIFQLSWIAFAAFIIFWGMVVITDSPQFSTLVAYNAPKTFQGTALTIVNSLGFAITIFSIQLLNTLLVYWDPVYIFVPLAIGPVMGLIPMFRVFIQGGLKSM